MSAKKPTKKKIDAKIQEIEAKQRKLNLEIDYLEYERLAKRAEYAKTIYDMERLNVLREFGEEY